MASNKQIDDWEDVPISAEADDWQDVPVEKTVGERNLERFGTADVSPSFMEQVMDVVVPVTGGLSQGLTAGFADELGGAATAAAKDIGSLFSDEIQPGDYETERDALRDASMAAQEANPALYMGGNIAGAAGTAAAAPGSLLARGVAQGAAMGAGAAPEIEDVPEEAAFGAATGAVAGKLLPGASRLSAKGAGKIKEGSDKIAKHLSEKMATKKPLTVGGLVKKIADTPITPGSVAGILSGVTTAKTIFKVAKDPLMKAGFKTAKALSGVGQKSLNALAAASERGGAPAVMATHNMLLQSDEKYRKAITKNQESE